jgi:hypothetical protein
MSVMIVSEKTLNNCVLAISQMKGEKENISLKATDLIEMGQKLLEINIKSYELRYNEKIDEPIKYEFKMPNIFKFFKNESKALDSKYFIYGMLRAVETLRYQLMEDIVDESEEYKLLEEVKDYLIRKGDINEESLYSLHGHSIWDSKEFNEEFNY